MVVRDLRTASRMGMMTSWHSTSPIAMDKSAAQSRLSMREDRSSIMVRS
jgi:hypothetical protein